MANEVVAQNQSFSVQLGMKLDDAREALPANFNKARFIQNALSLMNGNESLANFARQYGTGQIIAGLMKGAFLNLDAMANDFYLIAFSGTLNFMKSYRGDQKLCEQYSERPVKSIYARVVRDGDLFEESIVNGEPTINFKAVPFNSNPIIGAFAVCLFKDGGMVYDVMNMQEIETTRKHSKQARGTVWNDFYSEMCKKTVLHRLCKHITLNFNADQRKAFDSDMEIETDPAELARTEIAEEANSEAFVMPEMP